MPAMSDESRLQIVLKKLMGRATTKTKAGLGPANEGIPTNIQTSASTIFAEQIPDIAVRKNAVVFPTGDNTDVGSTGSITNASGDLCDGTQYPYEDGVVESIRLKLVPVDGTKYDSGLEFDTSDNHHGYTAQLPDNYTTKSNNPKKNTGPWANSKLLYTTQGRIQCVPPIYGFDENSSTYSGVIETDSRIYSAVLIDDTDSEVSSLDSRNWYFDYYSGVLFQERSGIGADEQTLTVPAYIDVLVYIGDFVDEAIESAGGGEQGVPGDVGVGCIVETNSTGEVVVKCGIGTSNYSEETLPVGDPGTGCEIIYDTNDDEYVIVCGPSGTATFEEIPGPGQLGCKIVQDATPGQNRYIVTCGPDGHATTEYLPIPQDGAPGVGIGCTISVDSANQEFTIQCGSQSETLPIPQGLPGDTGSGCVSEAITGGVKITCGTNAPVYLYDGADGQVQEGVLVVFKAKPDTGVAAQTIQSDQGFTPVALAAADFNLAGEGGSTQEYDTSTHIFSPTFEGKYNFRAQIKIKSATVVSAAGGKITLAVYKNGVSVTENAVSVEQDGNLNMIDTNVNISTVLDAVAVDGSGNTDEFALYVKAEGLDANVSYEIESSSVSTFFEGFLVTAQKGEKGDAFEFGDFTSEQLDVLKGDRGEQGSITVDGFLEWAKGITDTEETNEVVTAIGEVVDTTGDKWQQPDAPPPPMFAGEKERDLVKQVNDELIERVIGQTILYYPISQESTNYHTLYGEAINKTFLPPIRVYVLVDWEGTETTSTNFGIDRKASLSVHFHKRRLTDDQDLYVREGDFIQYGDNYFEIVSIGQPKELFGRTEHKMEIVAKCTMAREGLFNVA